MNYEQIDTINFSIILCCYNSERHLQDTLLSISNQTYKKFELIIVDDGSTDNTQKIIDNFKKNSQIDIKYFYKTNSGLADSRNFALRKTNNKWISIIDHDDIWIKNKLEIQSNEIKKNYNKKLFFSDFYIFSKKNKISRFRDFEKKDKFIVENLNLSSFHGFINLILCGCFIGSSTVIFDKSIAEKIGGFDNKYKFLTDYIFFIKLSKIYEIHCTPKILSLWRYHEHQASNKMVNFYYIEMFNLYFKLIFFEKIYFIVKFKLIGKLIRLILSYAYSLTKK